MNHVMHCIVGYSKEDGSLKYTLELEPKSELFLRQSFSFAKGDKDGILDYNIDVMIVRDLIGVSGTKLPVDVNALNWMVEPVGSELEVAR